MKGWREFCQPLLQSLPCRYVALCLLVACGAIWGTVTSRVEYEHREELMTIQRTSQSMAVAFEYHILHQMKIIDEQLLFLKKEYETTGQITPAIIERVHTVWPEMTAQVFIVNEKAEIKISRFPPAQVKDFQQREYFQVHYTGAAKGIHIDKPVASSVDGRTIVHVSRRLNDPDGRFAGVVGYGIEPRYFSDFYREMGLGAGYVVTVFGLDGVVRMRQTAEGMTAGEDIFASHSFQRMLGEPAASFIDVSPIDEGMRIYSYRIMKEYPLVVRISVAETDGLAEFQERKVRYYWTGGLAIVLILLLGGYLIRLLWQQRAGEQALLHANELLEHKVEERTMELQALNHSLAAVNEDLQRLTLSDGLTGIANRRYFNEYLEREWRTGQRQGKPMGLVMADIDYFKRYNDAYGHQAGDACLKEVAALLTETVHRPADLAARYGGEEFAIVLPDTDLFGAVHIAEQLRRAVEMRGIAHRASPCGHVTISLGVAAVVPASANSMEELIKQADLALYQAKRGGRNCTVGDAPETI